MKKILLILVSVYLTACSSTNIEHLKIPTDQSAGIEHQQFEQRIEKALSPYQQQLLTQYRRENPNTQLTVLDAIATQEKKNAKKKAEFNAEQKRKHEQKVAVYEQALIKFKNDAKIIYLKTTNLNDASVNALIASDIAISNIRLVDYKINRIQYLSPNNPKVYRINAKYAYDLANKGHFDIHSADIEFSLNYDLEELVVKKKMPVNTNTSNNNAQRFVEFSIQSATKITENELQKIIPMYRLSEFKNNQYKKYTLEDFDKYKEKLQFRITKLAYLLGKIKDINTHDSSLGYQWRRFATFSPIMTKSDDADFVDYLLKTTAF